MPPVVVDIPGLEWNFGRPWASASGKSLNQGDLDTSVTRHWSPAVLLVSSSVRFAYSWVGPGAVCSLAEGPVTDSRAAIDRRRLGNHT